MARGKVKSALALNEPVAMVDMPLLVRLLWKGKNVFSRSWLRDWFVVFKNRHAFFSVFLCHPQHPFTWKERFFLIVCVLMMGWALATAAEVALTRAEEIALENAKGDDEETARAYERYRDFKDKNGATVTLFGSIIVQSFCARPAAPASSLLPPHAVTTLGKTPAASQMTRLPNGSSSAECVAVLCATRTRRTSRLGHTAGPAQQLAPG